MVLLLIKNMLDAQESHPTVTYWPDRRSEASGRLLDVIAFFRNEGLYISLQAQFFFDEDDPKQTIL